MKFFPALSALTAVALLAACTNMPQQQAADTGSGTKTYTTPAPSSSGSASTSVSGGSGIDCSVVPRSKSEIAVYREQCL